MTLLSDPVTQRPAPAEPELGVIEEARRRREARRTRMLATLVALMLLGAVAWALLSSGSPARSSVTGDVRLAPALTSDTHLGYNLRLWPALGVGRAGWCVVVEEHGRTEGSACGPPLTLGAPLIWSFGFGRAGARGTDMEFAVVGPQVAAVLVGGHRVQTTRLGDLPYGMRAFRATTHPGSRLVALDGAGHPIAEKLSLPLPGQATVRKWRVPERPPHGSCELRARDLPGLSTRGGRVAAAIAPFPGRLVGHAFLPCIATRYELHGTPLEAILLLDAATPRAPAPALPGFHAVRSAPGILAAGELTARRSGLGWLIAEQGSDPAQRILLLRHLTGSLTASR